MIFSLKNEISATVECVAKSTGWLPWLGGSKLVDISQFVEKLLSEDPSPMQYALASLGHSLNYCKTLTKHHHLSPKILVSEKVDFEWVKTLVLFFAIRGPRVTIFDTFTGMILV